MLRWAIFFLLLALVAALFGFGGLAAAAVEIAQILFAVFIILFLVVVVLHFIKGRRPPAP